MTLIEFGDIVLYKEKDEVQVPEITTEDLKLFKRTIAASAYIRNVYENTDHANSFYEICPDVKAIVGAKKCVECFYACKTKFYMRGIPAKLVYVLSKAHNQCEGYTPNAIIAAALPHLKTYAGLSFKVGDKSYTTKDIIETIFGQSVKLLNSSVRKVSYGDVSEIYVPDVDRVLILPTSMADMLSHEDCEKLTYTNDGVMYKDIPVRTLGSRLGITTDDFDLRNCI